MSVKQIGGCVQKQQMDWGAAERGGGTQPLFSLLSVCLHFLSVCMSAYLSVCLPLGLFGKCFKAPQYAPVLLESFVSPLLLSQSLKLTNSSLFLCLLVTSPSPCPRFSCPFLLFSSLYLYLTFLPFCLTAL